MTFARTKIDPAEFVSACLVHRNHRLVAEIFGLRPVAVLRMRDNLIAMGVNMPEFDKPSDVERITISSEEVERLNAIAAEYAA